MPPIKIGTLQDGECFLAEWHPAGRNIGVLIEKSIGSCLVKIPAVDGSGWDLIRWSLGTEVSPAAREEFNLQSFGSTGEERNRSAADSPVSLVHQICSEMRGAKRDAIIAACAAKGVNINTAKTQYYHWRKQQK